MNVLEGWADETGIVDFKPLEAFAMRSRVPPPWTSEDPPGRTGAQHWSHLEGLRKVGHWGR